MSIGMKFLKLDLFVGLVLAAICVCVVGCRPSHSSRSEFIQRSPDYYSNVVEGCRMLLLAARADNQRSKVISGTNETLPFVLRELRASSIDVYSEESFVGDTNLHSGVFIKVGQSRLGYGVTWLPEYTNRDIWILSASDEGGSQDLLKTRPLLSGQSSP